jgi:hypothetical protein
MRALRILLVGCLLTASMWAADATGKWTAEMQGRGGQTMTVTMNLKADGDKLTGNVSGRNEPTDITDGKIDGNNISFSVVRQFNGNQIKQTYKGKLDGDVIHFSMTMEGGQMGNAPAREFDAKRAASGM